MIVSGRTFLRGVLMGAALAGVAACARQSDAPKSAPTNEPFKVEAKIKDAPELVARAKLTCAEASECPENVALMITVTERKDDKITYHQCTSFLVADDIVATNSHCVPAELRNAGASCACQIAFLFPSKTGTNVRAACAEVISATKIDENPKSEDYLRKVDVAFLKLTQPVKNVTPFRFDRKGLPDGTRLRALVIDPVKQGKLEGLLKIQDCSTVQATFANPSYVTETAAIATAGGCEVRTGNSGAPAIDDAGAVRAVVFGVLQPEMMKDLQGYSTPGVFQAISYLSNSACIDVPSGVSVTGARENDGVCDRRLLRESLRERARANANLDLESSFTTWKQSAPVIFGYRMIDAKAPPGFTPLRTSVPMVACINSPAAWPSAKALQPQLEKYTRTGDVVTAALAIPVWAGTYNLDELYRVSIRASQVDRAVLELAFDAKSIEAGPTKVDFKVKSDGRGLKTAERSANLKLCDAEQDGVQ